MKHENSTRWIQRFKRLTRDRHFRSTQQQIAIEGIRNVIAANQSQHRFVAMIRCKRLLRSAAARETIARQAVSGVPIVTVTPQQFRDFSTDRRASGIAGIVSVNTHRISTVVAEDTDCWIAVTVVRSVGNLGCLIRTAAAVQARGFILIGQSVDPYAPEAIRASMGAIFRQKIVRSTWTEFADWCRSQNASVIGACPSGNANLEQTNTNGPTVLMLGEERRGLSSRQRKHCDQLIRIPMASTTDSLNLAVAGSILLYEIQIGCGRLGISDELRGASLLESGSSPPQID